VVPVTQLLVFQARDGILLVADGQTSEHSLDGPIPIGRTTQKIVPVAGVPIGVLVTGRATFPFQGARRTTAELCALFLDEEFKPPAGRPTVEQVAVVLKQRFGEIDDHKPASDDLTLLVAGYSPDAVEPGDAQVLRVQVRGGPPQPAEAFGPRGFCVEPNAWVAAELDEGPLGLTWDELVAEAERRGIDENSDAFAELWDFREQAPHRLLGSSMQEIREHLVKEIPKAIERGRDGFDGNGVGGTWRALELTPNHPASQPTTLIDDQQLNSSPPE
jgi:hypothetical protein